MIINSNYIKESRIALGLSQTEVSERQLKMSRTLYNHIENGKTETVSVNTLVRIVKLLKLDINKVFILDEN